MSLQSYYEAVSGFPGLQFDKEEYTGANEMVITIADASEQVKKQVEYQAKDRGLSVQSDGTAVLVSVQ